MKKKDLARRLPLLGMMGAAMILGASVEIIPIAYHVNLTVVSGILLGPALIFLATFVVNLILALFGHGGITVIGLNTLILSIEGILAYFFFHLFHAVFRRVVVATFIATFLALLLSTLAMIGVLSLGVSHYEELVHHRSEGGFLEVKLLKEHDHDQGKEWKEREINLKRFIAVILPLSLVGWVLESLISALTIRYIHRLRPELLRLTRGSS